MGRTRAWGLLIAAVIVVVVIIIFITLPVETAWKIVTVAVALIGVITIALDVRSVPKKRQ